MQYFIIFLVFIVLLWIFLILKFSKKRWLSQSKKNLLLKKLKQYSKIESPKEKIVDYDKLYHQILLWLWYSWTFWEILKLKPKEISDLNKIWELHKLRNKLVHDFDHVSLNTLEKKSKEYERAIFYLLK